MTLIITTAISAPTALVPASTTPGDGYYTTTGPYTPVEQLPNDYQMEVTSTCGAITPSPTTCVYVFVKVSEDGVNYSSGPESSNDVTDEMQLYFVGIIPHTTASQLVRKVFNWGNCPSLSGIVPKNFKIVCRNATGLPLAGLAINIYENFSLLN